MNKSCELISEIFNLTKKEKKNNYNLGFDHATQGVEKSKTFSSDYNKGYKSGLYLKNSKNVEKNGFNKEASSVYTHKNMPDDISLHVNDTGVVSLHKKLDPEQHQSVYNTVNNMINGISTPGTFGSGNKTYNDVSSMINNDMKEY